MKKILYTASRISHIINFHMPYIDYFKKKGYIVHILTQGKAKINIDKIYDISFEKKITSLKNIKTINYVKSILEKEKYDLIITNTTLASFVVRMAKQISKVKKQGQLINIVHGYLFSKNTPIIKKIPYILAEKLCMQSTNLLLTMNKEDFEIAKKYKLCKYEIKNIRGMGIPTPPKFFEDIKIDIRKKYNIKSDDILILYAGELSKRKNQIFLIQSMNEIIKKIPKVKLILAGDGDLYKYYKEEIKRLNLENSILMTGHIKDIKNLIYSSNIVISSSKSEGLPFNIMEAMSLKIPVIASNVKGHTDLIKDGYNGYLFEFNKEDLIKKLNILINCNGVNYIIDNEEKYIKNYLLDYVFDENINLLDI